MPESCSSGPQGPSSRVLNTTVDGSMWGLKCKAALATCPFPRALFGTKLQTLITGNSDALGQRGLVGHVRAPCFGWNGWADNGGVHAIFIGNTSGMVLGDLNIIFKPFSDSQIYCQKRNFCTFLSELIQPSAIQNLVSEVLINT